MKKITALLLMMILSMFIFGCSNQNDMNVEKQLVDLAKKEGISAKELAHLKYGLKLKKLSNRYELIDKETNNLVYYIDGAESFCKESKDPFEDVYYMLVDWGSDYDLTQGIPYWAYAQF